MEVRALCYLGDARLARGDPLSEADLRGAITPASSDSRVETRVPCYVSAAGGAYHSGRPDEAKRYVAAGLRAAAGHTAVQADLCAYLRRAAVEVAPPVDPPGLWAPRLASTRSPAVRAGSIASPASSCRNETVVSPPRSMPNRSASTRIRRRPRQASRPDRVRLGWGRR